MKKLLKLFSNQGRSSLITPSGILYTVVPREFEQQFPFWDKQMCKNNKSNPKIVYVSDN